MAEREQYGKDRSDWRGEDRDRERELEREREQRDRDFRSTAPRHNPGASDYGRPTSGYGMEGYGPERPREGWRSDEERRNERREENDERWKNYGRSEQWRTGQPRSAGQGWGAGGFRGQDWGDNRQQPDWGRGYEDSSGRSQGSGSWSERGRAGESDRYRQYPTSGTYGQGGYTSSPGSTYGSGTGYSLGGYGGGAMAPSARNRDRVVRPPRNYRRSDERIREDICEAIVRANDLDAGDVEVEVNTAEVTLIGMVEDREDKRRIEDIAHDVSGVTEVNNQLRTRQASSFREALSRTGEAIKQFVKGEPSPREQSSSTPPTAGTNAGTSNPPSR